MYGANKYCFFYAKPSRRKSQLYTFVTMNSMLQLLNTLIAAGNPVNFCFWRFASAEFQSLESGPVA